MSIARDLLDRIWRSRLGAVLRASAPTRHDASGSGLGYGAGGKVEAARPDPVLHLLDSEHESLASTGLGRRLTWGVAADALRAPWDLPDGRELPRIEGLEWRAALVEATASARMSGGAHLLIVTDDGADLTEPLPPGPHGVLAVHVLTARDARPRTYEVEIDRQGWTRPVLWDVHPIRQDVPTRSYVVHTSRLVYIPGLPMAASQRGPRRGYDLSVLDAYWPALRRLDLALESATLGAVELSTPWVRLRNSVDAMSGDGGDSAVDRLEALQYYRSMGRLAVLQGDDELGRDNVSLTGLRSEVVIAAYEAVCALEGLSLTYMFGQPPAGLSSTDEAGRRNDARALDAIRRGGPTQAIQRIMQIATGEAVEVEWAPIDVDDPAQSAALVGAGIADPEELRPRHGLPPRDVASVEVDEAEVQRILAAMGTPPRADAETYTPPDGAQGNAKQVLRWREEHGDAVQGMTRTGWTRARQLASGRPVSRDVVGRMAAFARHRRNAEVAEEYRDEPWRDAGHVAWLGWGGTTGVEWAIEIVEREG